LRNQIAPQQRNQHLRKGRRLPFGGSALFFGGLAFKLDRQLEECHLALDHLVHAGFGGLLLAAVQLGEHGACKAAPRPCRGNLLLRPGCAHAIFVIGAQGVVGRVAGLAWMALRSARRVRGMGGFRAVLFAFFVVCVVDIVVAHARSSQSKTGRRTGVPLRKMTL
jgi:hypothetical protein